MMRQAQINNRDNQIIALNVFEAENSLDVLLIAPATGVKQSFYKNFADYIVSSGITVITFDYSGIGNSLSGNIKKLENNASDWGEKDMEAVIQYVVQNYLKHRLTILGHSIGGQLIGLAKSSSLASKIILIAAQTGYWKYWKGGRKIKMWMIWNLLFPTLIRIFGYMPSKRFSGMENLPGNVARQWSSWGRNPEYLFADVPQSKQYYASINCPITSFSIEEDVYAPKEAVQWLTNRYKGSEKKMIHLESAEYATKHIGHFGIFNTQFKNSIWQIFLEEVKGI